MQSSLHTSKTRSAMQSRVSLTTRTARNVNQSQTRGTDDLEDPAGRTERLWDWRQDSRAPPEEEDWPCRPWQAHRAVAGAALEDRARTAVPHVAHAAAHRARLWRRAGVLLRWRA